ncbi:MAG: hypothetical protein OXU62_02465 [Gammaproteobacteria bacterium]|nr:hypothetical protein [Gammaproteobacteria bacterium]
MKLKIITLAIVAITVAPPTADAAWQVKKGETNTSLGYTDAYALTSGKVVSDDGVGAAYSISRTLPHTLRFGPCWKEVAIITEYAAIAQEIRLAPYHVSRKNSWYQFDGDQKVGTVTEVHKNSHIEFYMPNIDSPEYKRFEQGIKKANTMHVGIKHDYGELVFRFDLTGSSRAIAKAKAICSGK